MPAALLRDRAHRRAGELIAPASVIIAGVLFVVLVAGTVAWSIRSVDKPSVDLPAQPPALGTGPLTPTDPVTIPIPSVSPSTPRPSPGVTESPPSARPKPRPTTPPADPGNITLRRATVPSRVNLTTEGTRDWAHWGQHDTFSLERRRDGGSVIKEVDRVRPRFRHALSAQRFAWERGTPVARSNGTPTGVRTCGRDNGFTVNAPAGQATRTLRLYVGVLRARGRLDARLSTGGERVDATLRAASRSMETAVFTLTYRAPSNGATIRIRWVTEDSFDRDCGGVALQAATLR